MKGLKKQSMSKEQTQHQNGSGGFINGLVLGVIIGAGLVFLFCTKRGKQVLKAITENGVESFSDLTDILQNTEFEDEEEFPQDGEVITPKKTTPVHPASASRPVKRFFRGVKK